MTNLSWTDISVDNDYKYAFTEISHYIYSIENDGAQSIHLACALLERAQSVMNYQDPWDGRENGQWQEDKDFTQLNRLMNFMDTIGEFTDKRLALLKEGDAYMDRKTQDYARAKSSAHIMMNDGLGAHEPDGVDYDVIIELIEALEQDLIVQGIPRMTLAKIFVDCAFVHARKQSVDHFVRFCCDLKSALGQDCDFSGMFSTAPNAAMHDAQIPVHGSSSIH